MYVCIYIYICICTLYLYLTHPDQLWIMMWAEGYQDFDQPATSNSSNLETKAAHGSLSAGRLGCSNGIHWSKLYQTLSIGDGSKASRTYCHTYHTLGNNHPFTTDFRASPEADGVEIGSSMTAELSQARRASCCFESHIQRCIFFEEPGIPSQHCNFPLVN